MVPTTGRSTQKARMKSLPSRLAALQALLKIRHQSFKSSSNIGKRKSKWLLHHHKASRERLVHTTEFTIAFEFPHESASCEQRLISSASLTSQTCTTKTTKPCQLSTAYTPPAIIKITAHVRGCLIKSDRSSVACYEVRTIVIHY